MSGLDGGGGHGGGDHSFSHDGGHGHSGLHHGGGDAHGGHATHEAMMIAFSHGSQTAHSVVGHHVSSAHPHSMQAVHLGLGRQDTKEGGAADPINPEEVRTYVVHVANHGQSTINHTIEKVARQCDMLRLDTSRPNFDPVDITKNEIADWTAFSEPYARVNMPEGYFPGAKGRTRIWRQYWQVGKRPSLWAPKTPPVFNKHASTFIEMSIITWLYEQTGDYETKFMITVVSLPVWDEVAGAWGYKKMPFQLHQRAAKKMCEEVFAYLASIEPTAAAKHFRAETLLKYPPPPAQERPDGVVPGTPEDDADLSRGRKDDWETHPPSKPDPAGDGDGDVSDGGDGGDGGDAGAASLIASEAVVASGSDLSAVLGHADSVVVAAPGQPALADLVVEIED